ncbi:hypothetical protein ACQZV8_07445 [Magnetococcales bacterium HHB-1]
MDKQITLSFKQLDNINLSLSKARSVSQVLIDCGTLGNGALEGTMRIVVEELENIIAEIGKAEKAHASG